MTVAKDLWYIDASTRQLYVIPSCHTWDSRSVGYMHPGSARPDRQSDHRNPVKSLTHHSQPETISYPLGWWDTHYCCVTTVDLLLRVMENNGTILFMQEWWTNARVVGVSPAKDSAKLLNERPVPAKHMVLASVCRIKYENR